MSRLDSENFKSINSSIYGFYIGWYSSITGEKESGFSDFSNALLGYIPFVGRKVFQNSSALLKLYNGKNVIIEYGDYESSWNHFNNSMVSYWNSTKNGLRLFEDSKDNYFEENRCIELEFDAQNKTLKQILEEICRYTDYTKYSYNSVSHNSNTFISDLIKHLKAKRPENKYGRGNHSMSIAFIPSEIVKALEENENDDSNIIGKIPVAGHFIDSIRSIFS